MTAVRHELSTAKCLNSFPKGAVSVRSKRERRGARPLLGYLKSLEEIGVNHVALNLRFNQAHIETTLNCLAEDILPDFSG